MLYKTKGKAGRKTICNLKFRPCNKTKNVMGISHNQRNDRISDQSCLLMTGMGGPDYLCLHLLPSTHADR